MQLLYRLECRRRRKIGDILNEIWYRQELQHKQKQWLVILAAKIICLQVSWYFATSRKKLFFTRKATQQACGRGQAEVPPFTNPYQHSVDAYTNDTLPKLFAQF